MSSMIPRGGRPRNRPIGRPTSYALLARPSAVFETPGPGLASCDTQAARQPCAAGGGGGGASGCGSAPGGSGGITGGVIGDGGGSPGNAAASAAAGTRQPQAASATAKRQADRGISPTKARDARYLRRSSEPVVGPLGLATLLERACP